MRSPCSSLPARGPPFLQYLFCLHLLAVKAEMTNIWARLSSQAPWAEEKPKQPLHPNFLLVKPPKWGLLSRLRFPDLRVSPIFLPTWNTDSSSQERSPAVPGNYQHRDEIRMEHGCYEDFNRGGALFGALRSGADSHSDQHWQLVRDGRQEAPGALQELFQQEERPRLHLHLQQQPPAPDAAEGCDRQKWGLRHQQRNAAAG